MEITGYSERGAINALFYDIAYSEKSFELLEGLLSLAFFPDGGRMDTGITNARVFIEQSLSDFGDADAILLLDYAHKRSAVFVEAKVKPRQTKAWALDREFERFKAGWKSEKLNSSNLFTQLYHKARLMSGFQSVGVQGLKDGLEFPSCSTRERRKIGGNPVVLKMIDRFDRYLTDPRYLALVPDSKDAIRRFYDGEPWKAWAANTLRVDSAQWGALAWGEVETYCQEKNLKNACGVFAFNERQIY